MEIHANPYRGRADPLPALRDIPFPIVDAGPPRALIARCPRAAVTPLRRVPELARHFAVKELFLKDERDRMGLGSFKALGAAWVIARDAQERDLRGETYVTASAGNHGLSVAAGAAAFGARAVVYVAETVPESFAERLRQQGAEVRRKGATYEAGMAAAAEAARREGWQLLSDSSWPGYTDTPRRLMQGYLVLMAEIAEQMQDPPSHVMLQAGVGGLAGAVAAMARQVWGDGPVIVVVEPAAAPALAGSIAAGAPVRAEGPVSVMGRLDCKEPSLIALRGLARDADFFALISEQEAEEAAGLTAGHGLPSTASGVAGLAGLPSDPALRDLIGLGGDARVLAILSEAPEP